MCVCVYIYIYIYIYMYIYMYIYIANVFADPVLTCVEFHARFLI